jgi:uncharacterized protein (TIGR03067 family)
VKIALFLLLFVAAGEDAARQGIEPLQGTWKFISVQAEGTDIGQDKIKDAGVVIDGDKFVLIPDKPRQSGTIRVTTDKKPKEIDFVFTEGPDKGKAALAIYEREGQTWKICIAPVGKERPTEFVSKAGTGHVLEVLKKQ